MNITITGKEIKATEAIKDYVEKKLTRIEKYFAEELINVTVTIKKENAQSEIAEMYVSVKGVSYKAVTEDKDLYAAIDKDIDILEGQIRKSKAKKEKMMKDSSIKQMNINGIAPEKPVEDEVVKSLYYELKPISVEDAKLKLVERKGNIFYTFVNIDTGKVNVIFKLKDSNNYGLVEPEA
ncbi:MAG TPA: ribosome-associated translation inhibitor RaiA [Candidatus Scatovivens faecipullorum]|nr:ribosome-associated translation inhibitor RaiA [Candidatus Scatovivens faecipullorum]